MDRYFFIKRTLNLNHVKVHFLRIQLNRVVVVVDVVVVDATEVAVRVDGLLVPVEVAEALGLYYLEEVVNQKLMYIHHSHFYSLLLYSHLGVHRETVNDKKEHFG